MERETRKWSESGNKSERPTFTPTAFGNHYLCHMKRILFFHFLITFSIVAGAQSSIKDSSINLFMVAPGVSFHLPAGDLSNDFGANSAISLSVDYKLQNQFSFGIDGNFFFGNRIKDTSMLDGIRTSEGHIIDADGNIANILIYERGFTTLLTTGYLFTWNKPNPNAGIFVRLGFGFMQHKYRIEHNNNAIPLLEDDYLKGYDRLTNGFCLSQMIGYRYMSNKRLLNFFVGFEMYEGFTQNRRDWNFDLMGPDPTKRTDIQYGIRLGWILPIYKQAASGYHYF